MALSHTIVPTHSSSATDGGVISCICMAHVTDLKLHKLARPRSELAKQQVPTIFNAPCVFIDIGRGDRHGK